MKIVINSCYGGFSLSDEATKLYADKLGIEVTPVSDTWYTRFFMCKPEDLPEILQHDYLESTRWPEDKRTLYSAEYIRIGTFSNRPDKRDDPALVEVVEELGDAANGQLARLEIVEIPDDVEWQIEEYDGIEWVAEKHRTWP